MTTPRASAGTSAAPSPAGLPPLPPSRRMSARFAFSLAANLLRAAISAIAALVVARGLGAAQYGNLNFLLSTFTAVVTLLEMGSTQAFYSMLAQRRRGCRFFLAYGFWLGLQFVVAVVVTGLLLPEAWIQALWLGQSRWAVVAGFAAAFCTTEFWTAVVQMGEALRETARVQTANTLRAAVHLALLLAALAAGRLTVLLVLLLLVLEYGLGGLHLIPRLVRQNLDPEAQESWRQIAAEFVAYCRPLAAYAWVAFLYGFVDRWLLQRFGGAAQQGFFSIGQQFANIALLATVSILNIFWKEIAEAAEQRNSARMERLLRQVSHGLYLVAAWLCALLVPSSALILHGAVGTSFAGAALCLAIMLLYPVHQALGQIQSSFFYAVADTRTYSWIGCSSMLVSLPLTYVLLASPGGAIPGLGLGALGLAAEMVGLQVLTTNVQGWIIARRWGWRWTYRFQFVLLGLLALAGLCRWAATAVWPGWRSLPGALAGAALYIAASLLILLWRPAWLGLEADHIRTATQLLQQFRRVES